MFWKKACPDNYQVLWWMSFVSNLLEQIHSLALDETKEDEMIHNLWQTRYSELCILFIMTLINYR